MDSNQNNASDEITSDLISAPADWSISTLLEYLDRGYVYFPEFQRNYVWDKNKASKLIESFVLGLPVPQIFLYKTGRNKYQVIDGQQRILSLYFFKAGRFPKKLIKTSLKNLGEDNKKFITEEEFKNSDHFEDFKLKFPKDPYRSVENSLINKSYDELEESNAFGTYTVRIMIIQRGISNDSLNDESIYEIYSRLNSGGINLNYQEIRMGIGMSNFMMQLVEEVNSMPEWRSIYGKDTQDPRYKDIESLLRLCAAGDSILGDSILGKKGIIPYNAPMSKFLNAYSENAKKFNENDINIRVNKIKKFIHILYESDKAYLRKNSKNVSIPILEGLYGAFYKLDVDDLTPKIIREIVNDKDFIDNSTNKTTDSIQYKGRISRAIEFISGAKSIAQSM
jgi:hypothetical protein